MLLYIAVFPANINMALHPELGGGVPEWSLWARLPLQFVLIAWALWVGAEPRSQSSIPDERNPQGGGPRRVHMTLA